MSKKVRILFLKQERLKKIPKHIGESTIQSIMQIMVKTNQKTFKAG